MEKSEILIQLEKNINEVKEIHEKISLIKLAIFQKTINSIKQDKIFELRKYFENQINYYNQNMFDYNKDIDLIINNYSNQIDELIKIYEYLYINTFNSMQKAINNQIIAIGNIVKLYKNKEQTKDNKLDIINKKSIAVLQKKINYSVIIEECEARLDWCIDSVKNDMNEIFDNNFYQMSLYKNGFLKKIIRRITNLINGKKKFLDVIKKYKNENLSRITKNNEVKIFNIFTIATGVTKQIQNVEHQIANQYESTINSI